MQPAVAFYTIVLIGLLISPLHAEIFSWTDENGVKHFSNVPPTDAENVSVEFKEYQYDAQADQRRFEMEQEAWESIFREAEREKKEERQRAEAQRRNRKPTRAELIESEKQRLLNKIAELEEKPLEYFGSFKNKRVRVGFYKYRLETLRQDPDEYFNKPVKFEGNIKTPED